MIYSTSIGLDVHARSICASALVHATGEIVRSSFGCDAASVAAWARSLPRPSRAVYESGPTGFELKRS
ncbi:MAG: IS110 family transposase, partial [Atopobiaceae bacterium]|nr:IS110 family transposase [Atopobiaceae bacterium]